ncbi:hypothetical protein J8L08_14335 [Bacteroides fragilis]|jgi:hypothetical protein|uniref:hypothetical protein n=1 Tax=Bacteroides fragilis TaxID=817 RepID=UPI002030EBEC|nr:hypothetical protein [Bacteroides fragilis]MCM0276809.1 hypothetical protein [Bacteroides fragilis]DAM68223.1 MAG TPA: hypothetical protein [Caudoviricetes sp.]
MNSRPKYKCGIRFSRYVVYRMEYNGSCTTGTPVADFATPEEARRECSRLNEEARKNWEA